MSDINFILKKSVQGENKWLQCNQKTTAGIYLFSTDSDYHNKHIVHMIYTIVIIVIWFFFIARKAVQQPCCKPQACHFKSGIIILRRSIGNVWFRKISRPPLHREREILEGWGAQRSWKFQLVGDLKPKIHSMYNAQSILIMNYCDFMGQAASLLSYFNLKRLSFL